MNNLQIEIILNSDIVTSKTFKGVFACNRIPVTSDTNECFVVNTKPYGSPGEHWISIFKQNNKFEYFDSYGLSPQVNDIKKFLGGNYKYNKAVLQNLDTAVCGEYCIYFLYHRCRGISLYKIIRDLLDEPLKNDRIVDDFVKYKFEIPIANSFKQICIKRL